MGTESSEIPKRQRKARGERVVRNPKSSERRQSSKGQKHPEGDQKDKMIVI
jgi:hypothetical protein